MIEQLEYEYYKEYIKKFNNILNLTRIILHSIEPKETHDVITFHGGFNGNGKWSFYITQIARILEEFEGSWLIDLVNDCLDDVWSLRIGVKRK